MATSYPYTSSQGSLVKAFERFRQNFPGTVDAATLQKFSIAPANESYVISTFKFLGLIDENTKAVDEKVGFFRMGDAQFQSGLDAVLKSAYADLYSEQGEEPWTVSRDDLSTWFRVTDKTSDLIGGRQAQTYLTLAALAGHGDPIKAAALTTSPRAPKAPKTPAAKATVKTGDGKKSDKADTGGVTNEQPRERLSPFGLSVRIEVNLPAGGTPEVYDAIFASIRKNLMDP